MTNERLRAAIAEAGLTFDEFGEKIGVDPKTVERWITKDRVPHLRNRLQAASVLGKTDTYLWQSTATDPRALSATRDEFVAFHPNRASIPHATWEQLVDEATEQIDILAFAGTFLHDAVPDFYERVAARAAAGVRVRLLFGDPASAAVAQRGEEEGIGESLAARCTLTWAYLRPLIAAHPEIEARMHGSTLYASLFRFDNVLYANTHLLGSPAGKNPILQIEWVKGGMLFTHYMESFERTWRSATTV